MWKRTKAAMTAGLALGLVGGSVLAVAMASGDGQAFLGLGDATGTASERRSASYAAEVRTPSGVVRFDALSPETPRLLGESSGLAVLEGPGRTASERCLYIAPVGLEASGAVGCDDAQALARDGATFALASGDGQVFHVLVPPAGADVVRVDGRAVRDVIPVGGPVVVRTATGRDVTFESGSWARTSLAPR